MPWTLISLGFALVYLWLWISAGTRQLPPDEAQQRAGDGPAGNSLLHDPRRADGERVVRPEPRRNGDRAAVAAGIGYHGHGAIPVASRRGDKATRQPARFMK